LRIQQIKLAVVNPKPEGWVIEKPEWLVLQHVLGIKQ
jgi:hypothetical protein